MIIFLRRCGDLVIFVSFIVMVNRGRHLDALVFITSATGTSSSVASAATVCRRRSRPALAPSERPCLVGSER
ncbi:hypothetical protein AB5I41_19695 [Sphingomonas sp. MMS24-JH45]